MTLIRLRNISWNGQIQNIIMLLRVFEIIKNKILECNYNCLVESIVINSNLRQF
jgi:hypothetical protein